MERNMTGSVFIVGAGPGDPGLITRRGYDALMKADVVVYDSLIDRRLLDELPLRTEKIYAGKKAGNHHLSQEKIQDILLREAMKGKMVVRLKGGDPFVFGRGAEEALFLRSKGIRYEIVPGPTAGIAVPAFAGIPVTMRGVSSSFACISGHECSENAGDPVRWKELAGSVDTLVIYMGLGSLPGTVQKLVASGKSPETPVAVIHWGTVCRQITITGTLATIAGKVERLSLGSPVIIVVGEVVRFREILRWYEDRPLFGRSIVLFKGACDGDGGLKRVLEDSGAKVREMPDSEYIALNSMEIAATLLRSLHEYRAVFFRRGADVHFFLDALRELRIDLRKLHYLRFIHLADGARTALEERCLFPEPVLAFLNRPGKGGTGDRHVKVLVPCAAGEESEAGILLYGKSDASVRALPLYSAKRNYDFDRPGEERTNPLPDAIIFLSPDSVSNFVDGVKDSELIRMSRISAFFAAAGDTAAVLTGLGAAHVRELTGARDKDKGDAVIEFFRKRELEEQIARGIKDSVSSNA